MKKSRISPSLNLKGERWRVPRSSKTVRQEGKQQQEKQEKQKLQPPLRKKNLSSKLRSKLLTIREVQFRKGLLVVRVARSPLAPPRHPLGARHPPSLVTLITRGRTRTDILPRGGEQMSPQKKGRRRTRKKERRRKRKALRKSFLLLPLGGDVPGRRLPPPTPTTVRAGRSTG